MDEALMDPRPEARHVANSREWAEIVTAKLDLCRVCHWPGPDLELHHLVPRSQRGGDVAANIIPLCPHCHRWYTDREKPWRRVAAVIRRSLTPDEIAYVLAAKSRWWLDRMYPL